MSILIAILFGLLCLILMIYLIHFSNEKYKKILKQNEEKTIIKLEKCKKHNSHKIIFYMGSAIYFIIMATFLSMTLITKSANKLTEINNQYLVSVVSDSMAEKNKDNTYLEDNSLNNQLYKYDVCLFDKVSNIKDLKIYDIVIYKNNENKYITHRLIKISLDETLVVKGDNNTIEDSPISIDQVYGKYSTKLNFYSTINYFGNTPTFYVLVCFGIIDICIYIYFDNKTSNLIKKINP